MKARRNIKKAYKTFLILILSALAVQCSKDDDPQDLISAVQPALTSLSGLNTCDIGGCCLASEFDFSISYTASDGTEIVKINFDLVWSNGDTDSATENDLADSGAKVDYNWCYRFGDLDWVDVTHTLVSKNGAKSPPSKVRLMKPEGAN